MRKGLKIFVLVLGFMVLALPSSATVYAKIKGRVVDAETGQGLEGVDYWIFLVDVDRGTIPRNFNPSGRTKEGGFFDSPLPQGIICIGFYPEGKYMRDPDLARDVQTLLPEQCFSVRAGEQVQLIKRLKVGSVLEGRITRGGVGLKNVFLWIFPQYTPDRWIWTDENGYFRVEGLRQERVRISIHFGGHPRKTPDRGKGPYPNAANLECIRYMAPGTNELNIEAPWLGTTGVKGIVVDEQGRPLDPKKYRAGIWLDRIGDEPYENCKLVPRDTSESYKFEKFYYPPGKYKMDYVIFRLPYTGKLDDVFYTCPFEKEIEITLGKIKEIPVIFSPRLCQKITEEEFLGIGKNVSLLEKKMKSYCDANLCQDLVKALKKKYEKHRKNGKIKITLPLENCGNISDEGKAIILRHMAGILETACENICTQCKPWDNPGRKDCVRQEAIAGLEELMNGGQVSDLPPI